MTRHIWIKVNWITNRNKKKIFCKKEKNVIKSWLNFFAFQVFWMKKVCDEFYHNGTKKCDNRLFHVIKEGIEKNHFGASFSFGLCKTHGTDKKHGSPALSIT